MQIHCPHCKNLHQGNDLPPASTQRRECSKCYQAFTIETTDRGTLFVRRITPPTTPPRTQRREWYGTPPQHLATWNAEQWMKGDMLMTPQHIEPQPVKFQHHPDMDRPWSEQLPDPVAVATHRRAIAQHELYLAEQTEQYERCAELRDLIASFTLTIEQHEHRQTQRETQTG